MIRLESDVLVIGAGGAGIFAAIAAARDGCRVQLIDRSLIGRGGATVMAQMTVSVALGEQCPDHWEYHLADTLKAGRGLCDASLSQLLCENAALRIRELDAWKVGWARENGHLKQALAPGHDRPRCVYVDFLNTGPAVSRTLRAQLNRIPAIRRIGDVLITDIVVREGEAVGAVGLHLISGEAVALEAKSVIIATGGLTRLYRRNSGSLNTGGDGYALALRAGAELIDMEFVQFFPIGHLAPRMIGMDPIMWDPFRYKLGGRLLNAKGEEFADRYGQAESGKYALTRDVATYAIYKEVEAGRGSPAGGAYLSFQHVPEADLRSAFGPVIDRLARNGIDLTKMPVEVAPIAHYHMGGVRVNIRDQAELLGAYDIMMQSVQTKVPGARIAGVHLQRYHSGGTEVIIGARRDAEFGPVLLFGLGGVYTEVLKDVAFRLAPLTESDAHDMICELRAAPMLQGVRGTAAADMDALVQCLLRVSRLMTDFEEIAELDINPVLATADGCIAVDARAVLGG